VRFIAAPLRVVAALLRVVAAPERFNTAGFVAALERFVA